VPSSRLNPQQAREKLAKLAQETQTVEPKLAQKLVVLTKWIKDKKDGLLTSKPYVLDLLGEMILDAGLWLALKPLSQEDRQKLYLNLNFSVTQQYWIEILFPRWFNDEDPKFPTWRREVMNGNFKRDDEQMLRDISSEMGKRRGSFLWKHLLDLSMATDLLASGQKETVLCVQLTTLSEAYLDGKKQRWEETLTYWSIERGLLLSYNPAEKALVSQLVTAILKYSDTPTAPCYTVVTAFKGFDFRKP
jgi:acyl-CoA-binding protein